MWFSEQRKCGMGLFVARLRLVWSVVALCFWVWIGVKRIACETFSPHHCCVVMAPSQQQRLPPVTRSLSYLVSEPRKHLGWPGGGRVTGPGLRHRGSHFFFWRIGWSLVIFFSSIPPFCGSTYLCVPHRTPASILKRPRYFDWPCICRVRVAWVFHLDVVARYAHTRVTVCQNYVTCFPPP